MRNILPLFLFGLFSSVAIADEKKQMIVYEVKFGQVTMMDGLFVLLQQLH